MTSNADFKEGERVEYEYKEGTRTGYFREYGKFGEDKKYCIIDTYGGPVFCVTEAVKRDNNLNDDNPNFTFKREVLK